MSASQPALGAAAAPPEATWDNPAPGALWLRNWRLGEWLKGPMSPLFATFLAPMLTHARQAGGSARFGWRLPATWRVREPCYAVVNGYFFARADPDPVSSATLRPKFVIGELRGGWLDRWNERGLPLYLDRLERYKQAAVPTASSGELLGILNNLALDTAELWHALGLASGGTIPLGMFLRHVGGTALAAEFDGGGHLALLTVSDSPVVGEQDGLYQLARQASAAPELSDWIDGGVFGDGPPDGDDGEDSAGFAARLRAHIERYGHQTASLDFVVPCLAEQPDQILSALRCYQVIEARNPASIVRETSQRRAEATERVLARLPRPPRAAFRWALRRGQAHTSAREELVFDLQRGWPLFREILTELGGRLVAAEALGSAEEIYFIERDELWDAFDAQQAGAGLGERARQRRAQWLERWELTAPTHIPPQEDPAWRKAMKFPVDLRQLNDQKERRKHMVRGTAASAGQVRAVARVLSSPEQSSRLRPGEVLVTVATTPDWTPLFATAGAVVTDVGAVSSHASVVAREYGIPAVVGTQNATQVIGDGDVVTVDGSAGLVILY